MLSILWYTSILWHTDILQYCVLCNAGCGVAWGDKDPLEAYASPHRSRARMEVPRGKAAWLQTPFSALLLCHGLHRRKKLSRALSVVLVLTCSGVSCPCRILRAPTCANIVSHRIVSYRIVSYWCWYWCWYWLMVNGQRLMVNGQWSMVNGQWSMVNG